jgi:hypothetical protein
MEKVITINEDQPFNFELVNNKKLIYSIRENRTLRIQEIKPSDILLRTGLIEGEVEIYYKEIIARLQKKHVLLNAKVFEALWPHRDEIFPKEWQDTHGTPTKIYFDGTRFTNKGHANDEFSIICMFYERGAWKFTLESFFNSISRSHYQPSIVLPKQFK